MRAHYLAGACAIPTASSERPRFLSEADCRDIAQRLARYAKGGGETAVHIVSRWTGNVRWARNRITTTGEDRNNRITVTRTLHGNSTYGEITINEVSDDALAAAARRAERLAERSPERVDADVAILPGSPAHYHPEPMVAPKLFFESTYQLDADHRAEVARHLMQAATGAGMFAAGYIGVSATSIAYIASWGCTQYYQYTWAQYSSTVRDPKGVGSGWAGVDWPDWSRIDGTTLSAIALDKCLKSRNPVAIEPGRYTTILEPQAVCDFIAPWGVRSPRPGTEGDQEATFHKSGRVEPPLTNVNDKLGLARFGERVVDERLTISTDLLDPELGFPPFGKVHDDQYDIEVYHPAVWIERGILRNLPYDRGHTQSRIDTNTGYAIRELGQNTGLPASGAFRISADGPGTSVDEMIASTKRGLLVTRFSNVVVVQPSTLLCLGFTRDGVWLIENGKISKPVRNMRFVEGVLFALNNVEQIGVPQRCFHPGRGGQEDWFFNPAPVIAPALKVRDFSFTALSNAI